MAESYEALCDIMLLMQVETNKDKQLQRRVQSLQRFLMTRLKAELAQRAPAQLADQETSAPGAMDQTDAGSPFTLQQECILSQPPGPHEGGRICMVCTEFLSRIRGTCFR